MADLFVGLADRLLMGENGDDLAPKSQRTGRWRDALAGAFVGAVALLVAAANVNGIEGLFRAPPPHAGIDRSYGLVPYPPPKFIVRTLEDRRFDRVFADVAKRTGYVGGIRLDSAWCVTTVPMTGFVREGRFIRLCTADPNGGSPPTSDELLFVALHELGHAVIEDEAIPVLGREEDAADAFAAVESVRIGSPEIARAGADWFERQPNTAGPSDVHVDPQRRAYRIRCLIIGANPVDFGPIPNGYDVKKCVDLWKNQNDAWTEIFDVILNRKYSPQDGGSAGRSHGSRHRRATDAKHR